LGFGIDLGQFLYPRQQLGVGGGAGAGLLDLGRVFEQELADAAADPFTIHRRFSGR
jgi:hypothetical protein